MMIRMVTHIRMMATMMWKMRPRRIKTWTPVNRLTVRMMMMVMMILTTKKRKARTHAHATDM